MRIAVDLDGVVYEWDKTARYMLREYRRLHAEKYGLSRQSESWDYIQQRIPKDDWNWLWTEGVKLGLFRYGHIAQGAILGLQELLKGGHQLLAVTHRPTQAVPDTLAWLSYLNIEWSEVHILSNGESKTIVNAEVLIDDKPENCLDWAAAERRALLFNRPWNQEFNDYRIKRCYGWGEVVSVLGRGV